MKKVILVIAFLIFCSKVWAVPMLYTFDGTVNEIRDFGGNVDVGLNIGDSVTHIILIDFDRDGFIVLNNGEVVFQQDVIFNNGGEADFFFLDYISGSIIDPKVGGVFTADNFTAEHNFGWSETNRPVNALNPYSDRGILRAGSDDNILSIENLTLAVHDWQVGTELSFWNARPEDNVNRMLVTGQVTLVNIEPIPEPSTVMLLGIGIVGLVGASVRKRLKKSSQ